MNDTYLLDKIEDVAYVKLNRPRVLNALNQASRDNLISVMESLAADDDVRVIVLQGEGRAFCAGQDQKESAQFDEAGAARRIETYTRLFEVMHNIDKPIIAKIHGYAVGAGLQLALLADIRVMGESAKIGMTELNIGSPCITGSTLLWPVVGESVVRHLVLSGEYYSGEQALRTGLASELLPDDALDERIEELAQKMTTRPGEATKLTKQWWREITHPLFRAGMDHAAAAHAANFEQGGLTQGAKAFVGRER